MIGWTCAKKKPSRSTKIDQFPTTTLVQPQKSPSMEEAAAQPVVPPTPIAPPTKPPTAAALRKQAALEKKIATAARMEHAQHAKEKSMRVSESRPESGLTDAVIDRYLSIGLRRSSRAKVDGVVKAPEVVASQGKKAVKAHANEGAQGRGARGGARRGGRGGKANTGTQPGAKEAAAPVQQMPLVSANFSDFKAGECLPVNAVSPCRARKQ